MNTHSSGAKIVPPEVGADISNRSKPYAFVASEYTGWVEGRVIMVPVGNTKHPNAVFGNAGVVSDYNNENRWNTVSLRDLGVPNAQRVKAVFLSGILIITHGTTVETADMHITFRAPGDSLPPNDYQGQAVEAHVAGGQRSGFAGWVSVSNGQFEYFWKRSTDGLWPANSSYGINLSLQACLR